MKKWFLLLLCSVLFAAPVLAAQGPYIGGGLGVTELDDDSADTGCDDRAR